MSQLSDSYEVDDEEISLELTTTVLNINKGYNEDIQRRCPLLYEYIQYVECVREYCKEYELEEAVVLAVDECISKNILREFLLKNKAEVVAMSIYEYDEEKHADTLRKEGYEDGVEHGMDKMAELTKILLSEGKTEELLKLISKGELREEIFEQYGLQ